MHRHFEQGVDDGKNAGHKHFVAFLGVELATRQMLCQTGTDQGVFTQGFVQRMGFLADTEKQQGQPAIEFVSPNVGHGIFDVVDLLAQAKSRRIDEPQQPVGQRGVVPGNAGQFVEIGLALDAVEQFHHHHAVGRQGLGGFCGAVGNEFALKQMNAELLAGLMQFRRINAARHQLGLRKALCQMAATGE